MAKKSLPTLMTSQSDLSCCQKDILQAFSGEQECREQQSDEASSKNQKKNLCPTENHSKRHQPTQKM